MKWRRIAAGLHEREDCQHRVQRADFPGEGPKGGRVIEWVELRPDTGPGSGGWSGREGWIADGTIAPTLREAKRRIDKEPGQWG